ncbi:MAG: ABC transporter substrate-binding protein, partial [Chloroflexota bacterium]
LTNALMPIQRQASSAFVSLSYAQNGYGVIRQGIVNDLDTQFTSFNPLLCNDSACAEAVALLYPTLLAIDHDTRWFTAGTVDNNALASSWRISDDNLVYTFGLREDAFWSDGTPITAYDYFYTYLAIANGNERTFTVSQSGVNDVIEGVVPINEHQLAIIVRDPVCDVLPSLNLPFIVPAHAFMPTFAEATATFFADTDADTVQAQWSDWDDDDTLSISYPYIQNDTFSSAPLVTGGGFTFVDYDARSHIRLQHDDIAYELVSVSSAEERQERFLAGELSVLTSVSNELIRDFDAYETVSTYQTLTPSYDYIAFNLADPREPSNAFNEDGNPQEQDTHPILGNRDVRRAIALGIDREALIESALHGQGVLISGNQAPVSWAYDETLPSLSYDPDQAEQLLEDAGWVRVGNNRIRECVGCETVPDGTQLSMSLTYGTRDYYPVAAILIAQQLQHIGVRVSTSPIEFNSIRQQQFAMHMGSWNYNYPVIPGMHVLYTPEDDILGEGFNITSYNNPDATALIEQARTVPGCDIGERRARYSEAQAIITADLPYTWLYSETALHAAQRSIDNLLPQTDNFLWNLGDWSVFDVPR